MKTILKSVIILLGILSFSFNVLAHSGHDHDHAGMKSWTIQYEKSPIYGSFLMYKDGNIYIQKEDNAVVHFPLDRFSQYDQAILKSRIEKIDQINKSSSTGTNDEPNIVAFSWKYALIFAIILGLFAYLLITMRFNWSLRAVIFIAVLGIMGFTNNRLYTIIKTDPLDIDKAFKPFKPDVFTSWDSDYFYVESKGIPNHTMMKGITSWQQQVPIPQCYVGANAWSIPLNPELAAVPVPVNDKHFLRGAIAIAANGVPIFNPHTNTGVDALEDGQLDIYGGHSGRADDYHYHTAPLQLHSLGQTAPTNAIAYALDGFAVYGTLEPDGSPMKSLDANHGHIGDDGVYHYHGTAQKPYMIGNMVGKVTEDNTLQIIPQAAAKGVRPALTPLQGATITDFAANDAKNGYKLEYTRAGQKYNVNYSWNNTGKYTFDFVSPTGTVTNVYNGFTQCNVTTATADEKFDFSFLVYPNPSSNLLTIVPGDDINESDIQKISIINLDGKLVFEKVGFNNTINTAGFPPGAYILNMHTRNGNFTKKIIIY